MDFFYRCFKALLYSAFFNLMFLFQERRGDLSRLLGVHGTLKKVEFLFHLPHKIDECIADKNFNEVRDLYNSFLFYI